MAEFNISNSKIEQLNNEGNNHKIANNSAPVVVSGGDAVQTGGKNNMVEVAQKEKPSFWAKAWEWLKGIWSGITGKP